MKQPVFMLKNAFFSYSEDKYALKDINLNIYPGERLVVLGSNGSGKSTLLKLLNGLIFINSGSFTALGQQITEEVLDRGEFASFFRQNISFVFQNSDIQLFCATVYEDLMFGPLQLGLSEEEAASRADDLLEIFNIKEFKNSSPNNLSGGEKKKVAIATSLSVNPDIILLDEPTNNLDPRTRVWLFRLLNDLSSSGKTIVLSTQDLELAKAFSNKIIVMSNDHEIIAYDDSEKIITNKALLLEANLIHEHLHYHEELDKVHIHHHSNEHEHSEGFGKKEKEE